MTPIHSNRPSAGLTILSVVPWEEPPAASPQSNCHYFTTLL